MLPTKEQNEKGLHQKYVISRTDGKQIDPENEYFVLKLKGKGDKKHIEACRKAALVYAHAVRNHLPELSMDLINRYSREKEITQDLKDGERFFKIGDMIVRMFPVESSNVRYIGYLKGTNGRRDVIFFKFANGDLYGYIDQSGQNAAMHFERMLTEPDISIGRYSHQLTKELGFESNRIPKDIIIEDYKEPDSPIVFDFDAYQHHASKTAIHGESIRKAFPNLDKGAEKLLNIAYAALGLGESGEVQGKIKKIIRDSGGVITGEVREAIEKELGDQLWYIADLAELLGISLSNVAQGNIDKLFSRKERGTLKGSGDDR